MSIKQVAAIAGVSIATVSRYFNSPTQVKKETQEKVEKAIQAINYQPNTLAQNFRRGKSGIIIVVIHNIGNPIYEHLTQHITLTAQKNGYDILVKETNSNKLPLAYYRDMLSSKQADGLIVMVDLPKMTPQHRATLENLPIILIKGESLSPSLHCPNIGFDNYEAGETAAQHLIDLGHQHIACISAKDENIAYLRRQEGFLNRLQKENLFKNNTLYPTCATQLTLKEAMHCIIESSPRFTALFCVDDNLAIDALSIAQNKGINVPDQLSILGFNNIRYAASTTPPLSTIEQPTENIAQYSIEALCAKINGFDNEEAHHIYTKNHSRKKFSHRLITRASTAPPP